jgi:hypothetical protein
MAQESTPYEQAVSRALRDNLERVQRTSDELHQAIGDLVASCASSKPANALPPMLRAQTAAASLSASLDVLSRFVSVSMQSGPRSPMEAEIMRLASAASLEPPAPPPAPAPSKAAALAPVAAPPPAAPVIAEPVAARAEIAIEEPAEEFIEEPTLEIVEETPSKLAPAAAAEGPFDINQLSPEEQELHRRANRVAKVSMQDIKMLRPDQVRLGRENKDLCTRLRDDIEKAHKEYDRRFRPIHDHPVDYFHHWMVQILADGDAQALGNYPYASSARQ